MSDREALIPRPKGDLLRRLMRGEATVADIARESHHHPTVVRRHLQELTLAGFVESHPIAAARGRPNLRYRITTRGRELFRSRYDLVLGTLTRVLAERKHAPTAVGLYRESAKRMAAELGGPKSEAEVLAIFREIGFEPEARQVEGHRQILSRNCPILTVAREHPELTCDTFHCTLLGDMLDVPPPPLRQAISRGAEYCVHELEVPG